MVAAFSFIIERLCHVVCTCALTQWFRLHSPKQKDPGGGGYAQCVFVCVHMCLCVPLSVRNRRMSVCTVWWMGLSGFFSFVYFC